MRPFSLLASGIVGIGVALGNPSSTPIFLADSIPVNPSRQLSTLQGARTHPNELEERVLILKFLATLC